MTAPQTTTIRRRNIPTAADRPPISGRRHLRRRRVEGRASTTPRERRATTIEIGAATITIGEATETAIEIEMERQQAEQEVREAVVMTTAYVAGTTSTAMKTTTKTKKTKATDQITRPDENVIATTIGRPIRAEIATETEAAPPSPINTLLNEITITIRVVIRSVASFYGFYDVCTIVREHLYDLRMFSYYY